MRKWSKRLIACMLALMLVIPAFGLPESADAASKITLKSGEAAPSTIYAGHSYTLKVAGEKVKFGSSNKKIATIGATTGKMKATAPGTVTITAKNSKTGKKIATKTFKVLQRCTAIKPSPKKVYLNVGEVLTLGVEKKPVTSTDVIKFFTSDKTVATVGMTSGKVFAKGNGKTTIQVYALATKATARSNKYNKMETVDVFVGPYLDSAQQISTNEIKLKFKTSMKDYELKTSDFKVTRGKSKLAFALPVKEVSRTDSDREIKLTMYGKINDGKTYTVKFEDSSATFTATDGKIAALRIEPTEVEVQTSTTINVALLDDEGVVVERYNQSNKPYSLQFDIRVTGGYVSRGKLYFSTMKSKATASAVLHSNKYENGKEIGNIESGDVTITPIERKEEEKPVYRPSSSGSSNPYSVQYTVGEQIYENDMSGDDWGEIEVPDFIKPIHTVRSSAISESEEPVTVYFIIKKSGTEIENYENITVTSSEPEIAEVVSGPTPDLQSAETSEIVDGDGTVSKPVSMDAEGKYIKLLPKAGGVAYLELKQGDVSIASLPITVSLKEAQPYKLVVFDTKSKQITENGTVQRYPDYIKGEGEEYIESTDRMKAEFLLFLKDQYGDVYQRGDYNVDDENQFYFVDASWNEGIFMREGNKITADLSRGKQIYAVLAIRYRTDSREELAGSISVWSKDPDVEVTMNPDYRYDPALSEYQILQEAYTVKINGKPLELANKSNSGSECWNVSLRVRKPDSSVATGIKLEYLDFRIRYIASDGKSSSFSYRCTDPELLTLLPQASESAEGGETENPE